MITAPLRGLSICTVRAGSTFGIRQNSAVERRQLRNDTQRKKGVLGLLDRDILASSHSQVRIHPPQPVVLILNRECALVLQWGRSVLANPFAFVRENARLRSRFSQ